jgi:hypothetical protein
MECTICCSDFSSKNKAIKCQFCDQTACSTCVKRFLLESKDDPKCMDRECKLVWSREFLQNNFTKSFIDGEYKNHRKELLIEREKSFLPATQIVLDKNKRVEKRTKELDCSFEILSEDFSDARYDYKLLSRGADIGENGKINEKTIIPIKSFEKRQPLNNKRVINRMNELRDIMDILNNQMEEIDLELLLLRRGADVGDDGRAINLDGEAVTTTRKQFVRKCPIENCRGFLSSRWRCGTCESDICNKCYENKADDHVCDPDKVATVTEILKDSKQCPGCGINTHKIEGCSQMFCVDCKTVWDYNTGQKLHTNRIHNPHYYEWQRNGGGIAREPGDIPCGGLPDINQIPVWSLVVTINNKRCNIESCYYFIHELRDQHLVRLHHTIDPSNNEDLRLRYLLNTIDEKNWKTQLASREKRREMDSDLYLLYQMFAETLEDIFRRLYAKLGESCKTSALSRGLTYTPKNSKEYTDISLEAVRLTEYVHDQACIISKRYNLVVPTVQIMKFADNTNIRWIMNKRKYKTDEGCMIGF